MRATAGDGDAVAFPMRAAVLLFHNGRIKTDARSIWR
jgi:hypothetical protein